MLIGKCYKVYFFINFMRILFKLKSKKDVIQSKENNSKFYTGVHGWIYGKLNGTEFENLYGEKGFKLFCFSNLFKIENAGLKSGQIYNLIVSSPNEMFMIALLSKINNLEIVNFGEYGFELIGYKPLGRKGIEEFKTLESETLINVTVHEDEKRRALIFSRDSEDFIRGLTKNLIRKYNQFNDKKIKEDFNLFENVKIEEINGTNSAVKINLIKDSDNWFNVIGSRYRFNLGELNEKQREILNFCYDLGFGERNSFGFGFMNGKGRRDGGENIGGKIKERKRGIEDD